MQRRKRGSIDGFFSRHRRFLTTSETSAHPDRLDLRHLAIVEEFRDSFEGRRVVDIASHDGRWSYAALHAGASAVTGVEIRPDLVAQAEASLTHFEVDPDRFRFVTGDAVAGLEEAGECDTVLCLGFLYHTLNYNHLLAGIRATGADHVVVDTFVGPGDQSVPMVLVVAEDVEREGNAAPDDLSTGDRVLVGRPTVAALDVMFEAHGFRLDRRVDWEALLAAHPEARGIGDYRRGRRVTARYVRSR
ncbi:hypothetical protein GCM10023340_13800 [Nocardioides marinquilinus]|uniref:Methyltransferase domain-containing protein n=1 Tax=Nocardioides marinquilinus TaxID=1210400 RepID=A0ABP9PIY0_9ACTN